jgi:5'-nucleotidase
MTSTRLRVLGAGIAATALVTAVASTPAQAHGRDKGHHRDRTTTVQLLSFNDFHGHLEATDPPLSATLDPSQTPAGGAEYLATELKTLRAQAPGGRSLTVAAGDLIGGSTFLSGLFHDEPSVEALNAMDLDVSSVGNHEFDEGTTELLRMQRGAATPRTAATSPTPPTPAPTSSTWRRTSWSRTPGRPTATATRTRSAPSSRRPRSRRSAA